MAAENWTAQLHISDGLASEDAPEIAYAERPDAHGRAAALYILAEPDRPGSEPYIGDLVSRIGEDFLEGEGSLTGVLQRVIRERHEELLDWNRTSLPRDQASYGLSCLVVHEGDVFLMQVGPCLAYYRREGRLLRRRPASEAAVAPLGAGETSTPEFSHLRLSGDDWVLLISSDVARTVGEEAIGALRDRSAEDILPALYPKLRGLPRVSALVVAPGGLRPAEAPAEAPPVAEAPPARSRAMPPPPALDPPPAEAAAPYLDDPYDDDYDDFPERTPLRDAVGGLFSGLTGLFRLPRLRRSSDPWAEDGGTATEEPPRPDWPASPVSDPEVAAGEPSDIADEPEADDLLEPEAEVEVEVEVEAAEASGAAPDDAGPAETGDDPPGDDDEPPPGDAAPPPTDEEPAAGTEDAAPPGSARSVEYRLAPGEGGPGGLRPQAAGWPPNPFNTPAAPVLETGRDADAARFPFPIFSLEGGVPRFRRRRRPADPARAAGPGGMRRGWGALALAVLAVVAALGAVVGVLLVPDLLENSEQNRFEELLEDTRRGLTAASLTSDAAAGRDELNDAHLAIAAALELRPLDESALALRQEVETALSQINAVVRPPELVEVTNLAGRVPPPLALSLVQVGAGSLYLMDESGARVFSLPLAGGDPEVIFAAGDLYPTLFLPEQRAAAAPVGMHWAGGAAEPSLTILDANGQLFRFLPGAGVQALDMPGRELIGSPDAVAVDESGVYVLDVAGGGIWRFPQLPDGTLLEPQLAISRTDLGAAGSLAVGDSLFVAGSDGRIRRFEDGADRGFPLLDLDRPLLAPDSLAIGALTGLVYTVDRGNNRVAVFSAAGELVVQLRADELSGVRGVAPDESNGRLYFVTADALLTSALPPIIGS